RVSMNKKYLKVDLGNGCEKFSLKTHLNNIWKSVHSIENDIEYGVFDKLHLSDSSLSRLQSEVIDTYRIISIKKRLTKRKIRK
ncbi:3126_t:CDS:2, partial [Diversispora eburnea]